MRWGSAPARRVLRALIRIGWRVECVRGSHHVLVRAGWPDVVFAFHPREELGPVMLGQSAKRTGLRPAALRTGSGPSPVPVGSASFARRTVSALRGLPSVDKLLAHERSEERRVGKECRSRWSPY